MSAAQNLAVFFLSCQAMASVFLVIGLLFDRETFVKIDRVAHGWIPSFLKVVQLIRNSEKPIMMGVYFLSFVFIVLSYVGLILMVIQIGRTIL